MYIKIAVIYTYIATTYTIACTGVSACVCMHNCNLKLPIHIPVCAHIPDNDNVVMIDWLRHMND